MLVDRYGRSISSVDFYHSQADKAVIGPGANVYSQGSVIIGGTNAAGRSMLVDQQLGAKNPWIRTAEGLISKKLSTMDWHLAIHEEDETLEEPIRNHPARDFLELGSPLQDLTRSKLWGITSRHMGLCNNAFWYPDLKQKENGCIYINPARMTPAPDRRGYLSHWLLDADEQGENGIRFEKDEILWFQLEAADSGFFGHGLVYSAISKAMLSSSTDTHAIQTLDSGGRLQGILTPAKDDYLNDFQYESARRELRNVTELDDSAKRMVLLRKAVEFIPTTMKPGELELPILMRMSKEDIYEIWGVPRSQTGGMTEVGMNSGDRQSYEEAALQQNAIHPRLVVFEETVKKLLKTWDPRLDLEFEEPEFDDERPLFEMLKMSEFAPMTRNERRALINLRPLEGDVGKVVEQNPGLLQIDPPLPIARSMITGRLQDGSTVEPPGTPKDVEQHLDAINKARGFQGNQSSTKADLDEPIKAAIAERIAEKAEHFAARPSDRAPEQFAPKRMLAKVVVEQGWDKRDVDEVVTQVHSALKGILEMGTKHDWTAEEYADAVRTARFIDPPPPAPVDLTFLSDAIEGLKAQITAPTPRRAFTVNRDANGLILGIVEATA